MTNQAVRLNIVGTPACEREWNFKHICPDCEMIAFVMVILCPIILFCAGVPCWVIGNKRINSFGDSSIFSVPLCPTSDPFLYVGAPAIDTCPQDASPISFTASLTNKNRIWIAHNLTSYSSDVIISNSQKIFMNKTYQSVSGGSASAFPDVKSTVFCPIRPTLVTEIQKLEPACGETTGVAASIAGEFKWMEVGEADFGETSTEVTLDFGRVRARGEGTPGMFLVVSKTSSDVLKKVGISIVALSLIAEVPLLVYVLVFTCICPDAYWEWRKEEEYMYDKKWFSGQLGPEHY